MFKNTQSNSLAGTWGRECRERRNVKPVQVNYTSTFTDSYDARKFSAEKADSENRFVKFVSSTLPSPSYSVACCMW
jgi:hypothetical protein